MADVTSHKRLSRDISSSYYRGFFLFMQYTKWNSSAQSASVKKAAFFFGNQYPIKTNTKQASIHAKVQFQYTKCVGQFFSVMSI